MKKVYLLSIFMALTVGIAVYLFAASLQQKADSQAVDSGYVVVAAVEIPASTLITSDMVALVEMPRQSINPLAATSLSAVVGLINKYPLSPQEQILTPKLNKKGQSNTGQLSYVLNEGQRAISVGVDSVAGVSGYIAVGDYVDIVSTIILPQNGSTPSSATSMLLVENLLVLQTGMKQLSSTDSTVATYTTVTLSATPEQILKINYAATNGTLRFILRPVLDHTIVNPPTFPQSSGTGTTAGTASVP